MGKGLRRQIAAAAGVLGAIWLALCLALGLTAMIPRSAIEKNMREAADFYRDAAMFETQGGAFSVVHHYADAVLLNILWNEDSAHPFRSSLEAYYLEGSAETQGQNLYRTVTESTPPNVSYARYWHGSLIFLRALLTVLSVDGVKTLAAVLLGALFAAVAVLAWRRGQRVFCLALLLGAVWCRAWLIPQCFEYQACFFLALGGCLWVLVRYRPGRDFTLLFTALGALVCAFDFLTVETLTLCLPLTLWLCLDAPKRKIALRKGLSLTLFWASGYVLTWLCKWGLAAGLMGESLSAVALGQGVYRAVGSVTLSDATTLTGPVQAVMAVAVNLFFWFPFTRLSGTGGVFLCFGFLLLAIISVWYLWRKPREKTGPAAALFLIAAIPFVRYLVLNNHAALHPFFTYRALYASVVATAAGLAFSLQKPGGPPSKKRKGGRS